MTYRLPNSRKSNFATKPLSLIHWCTRALVAHGEMDHKVRVLERMPAPAQQIKRWTGQPLPLAARSAVRRMPDGSTRDHCRSGAETLPGVPRRRTYTVVVGPWCEGYWRRIGPYRPSHASRYSACLPPSCAPLGQPQLAQRRVWQSPVPCYRWS